MNVTFPGMTWPSSLTALQVNTYFPGVSCGAGIEISAAGAVGSGLIFFAGSTFFCSESVVNFAGSAKVSTNFAGAAVTVLPSAGTDLTR